MSQLLTLFLEFMYIGIFAVGGGLAAIPFLVRMSENYPEWFSLSMLADMIAVSEATPGPIGINMATYIGYTVEGIPGAILTSIAVTLPAFILLIIISPTLTKYRNSRLVDAVFRGLRPAVTGLIFAAGVVLLEIVFITDTGVDVLSFMLFVVVFICTQLPEIKKLHPVAYIGIAALIGVIIGL